MRKAKDGLTKRQRDFVREYHKTGNATQSAKTVGYSEAGAHTQGDRLLKKVEVQAELRRLEAQTAARNEITVDLLISKAWEVFASCMEGQVMMDRYGNPTSTVKRDHSPANKALENIGMWAGLNVDKRDVTTRSIDDLTEAELRAERKRVQEEIAKAEGKDINSLGDEPITNRPDTSTDGRVTH